MNIFNVFKRKKPTANKSYDKLNGLDDIYSGGDGLSIENAIVIHTESSKVGVSAEYGYVAKLHGQKGEYEFGRQSLQQRDGHYYDV